MVFVHNLDSTSPGLSEGLDNALQEQVEVEIFYSANIGLYKLMTNYTKAQGITSVVPVKDQLCSIFIWSTIIVG